MNQTAGKTPLSREQRINQELLPTWQPVAVLAIRCNIPVRAALSILLDMERKGQVRKVRTRIDGHNKVHLFKKLDYVKVLGVQMPQTAEVEEA